MLDLSFVANLQPNLVLEPVAGVCRIASQSAGRVGTFHVTNLPDGTPQDVIRWAISGVTPTSGITLVPDPYNNTRADLKFSDVPRRDAPYLLVITASDGTTQRQIPLAIVVRPGLTLAQGTSSPAIFIEPIRVVGRTYDPAVPSLEFTALGGGQPLPDVTFIPPDPSSLPQGLTFEVTSQSTARFSVAQPTVDQPVAGLQMTPQTKAITFAAYHPGTLYDSADNALSVEVLYTMSATNQAACKLGMGATFDPLTKAAHLDLEVFYLDGQERPYTVSWSVSEGAQGQWVGGAPSENALSVLWQPDGDAVQEVSFTAVVTDLVGTTTLTSGTLQVSAADVWAGTTALKLDVTQGRQIRQDKGKFAWLKADLPDLQATEGAVVTLVVSPAKLPPGHNVTLDPTYTVNLSPGTATPYALFRVPVPATAVLGDMWAYKLSVRTVSAQAVARVAHAQVLVVCNGNPKLVVTPATLAIPAVTGLPITPSGVLVNAWVQKSMTVEQVMALAPAVQAEFLESTPNPTNSVLTPVVDSTLALLGAPAGFTCAGSLLSGMLPEAGETTMHVLARKSGYIMGSSAPVVVSCTGDPTSVSATWVSAVVSAPKEATLTWTLTGTPTAVQVHGSTLGSAPAVVGSWTPDSGAPLSPLVVDLPMAQAFVVVVSNAVDTRYTPPRLVVPDTASQTSIPTAPVTATLDAAGHLDLKWVPPAINDTVYGYWTLTAKDALASVPYAVGGNIPPTAAPGLVSSFAYTFSNPGGYCAIRMRGFSPDGSLASTEWDAFKAFPAPRTAAASKVQVDLDEPVTIELADLQDETAGLEGTRWYVEFGDGTRSNDMPVTIRAVAKSYTTSGAKQIKVFVIADHKVDGGVPVSLARSYTLALPLVVTSNRYRSNPLAHTPAPEYEISGADGQPVAPEPFMAVVSSIARDTTTNELMLVVATARGDNASSQFGTMAADAFPLAGRPHTLDLVDCAAALADNTPVPAAALSIATTALEDMVTGRAVVPFQLQAQGGIAPYRWFAHGMPPGTFMTRDGVVTGAPLTVGAFEIAVSVMDAQNPAHIAEVVLPLQVNKSDVKITGILAGETPVTVLPTAVVGEAYSARIIADRGVAPYTWAVLAGSLPPGLTLDPNSGIISGVACTYDSAEEFIPGAFNPTIEVTDAVGATAAKAFPFALTPTPLSLLTVPDQAVVTLAAETRIRIPVVGGRPGYTLVSAAAQAPYAGFLLPGATLVNGMVQLEVDPAFAIPGASVSVAVIVRDSANTQESGVFTFTTKPAVPVLSWRDNGFAAKVGPAGPAQAVVLSELQGQSSIGVTSSVEILPPLTLATATIQATGVTLNVSVGNGGNQEVSLRATLTENGDVISRITRSYSVGSYSIQDGAQVMTVRTLPLKVGEFFAFDPQVPTRNAPAPSIPTFARVAVGQGSSLPLGVSLDSSTGQLYGRPMGTNVTSTSLVYFSATGDLLAVLSIQWSITPNTLLATPVPPQGGGDAIPDVEVGQPFAATLDVAGTALGRIGTVELIAGRLPDGMLVSKTLGTAEDLPTLRVTGASRETGVFDFALRFTDQDDLTRVGLFRGRIVVNHLRYLTLDSDHISSIVSGVFYSAPLLAHGGKAPYAWSINPNGPQLPAGLTLNPSTGVISGTTNVGGTNQSVLFVVTDSYGQTYTRAIPVVTAQPGPLTIQTAALPIGSVGGNYTATLSVTGGVPPYHWTLSPTSPGGLSFSESGVLSGVPSTPFNGQIVPTVTDSQSTPSSVTLNDGLTLVIAAAGTPVITPTPSPLPSGRVNTVYGDTISSGMRTGKMVAMALSSPGLAWHVAESLVLDGIPYVIALGGFRRAYTASYALAGRPAVSTAPLYFNPNTQVNDEIFGSWGAMGGSFDTGLTSHMMAASVKVSDTEIFVCGGVGNDSMGALLGETLDHAGLHAFDLVGGYPVADTTRYSYIDGVGGSVVSGSFPFPTDPVITQRFGHAACKVGPNSILICGGLCRDAAGVRDFAVESKAAYRLNWNRTGNTPTAAQWVRVTDMPVALAFHKAVTLNDGRVLVLGGLNDLQPLSPAWNPPAGSHGSNVCLIYDPSTDQWSFGTPLPIQVFSVAATVLPNGNVLVGAPAEDPSSLDPANEVNGVPLSTANCLQLYVPTPGGPGSWVDFVTLAPADAGNNPRLKVRWASTFHVGANGVVVSVGGEQNMTNLMGALFSNALVANAGADVLSNPQRAAYAYVTNALAPTGVYLSASGGVAPYHDWSVTPALPAGLSLDPDTGELFGNPQAAVNQNYTFRVYDSKASGAIQGSQILPLQIIDPQAPWWVTPAGDLGVRPIEGPDGNPPAFSFQLQAADYLGVINPAEWFTGGYGYTLVAGALPPGVTLSLLGRLSGVPTEPGTYNFTVRITNAVLNPLGVRDWAERSFTLIVYGNVILKATWNSGANEVTFPRRYAPGLPGSQGTITAVEASIKDGTIGEVYSATIVPLNASGPITWTLQNTELEGSGLTTVSNPTTFVIQGTPTPKGGQSVYTLHPVLRGVDAKGVIQEAYISLHVGASSLRATGSLADATTTIPYTDTITIEGGVPPYVINSVSGIPDGMTYSFVSPTLTISGAPTVYGVGVRSIAFQVTDAGSPANVGNLTAGITVVGKTYTWESGYQNFAPTEAPAGVGTVASPLYIGNLFARYSMLGYGQATGPYATKNAPWVVNVTGTFATPYPTLSIANTGGVTWVVELITAPAVNQAGATARFGIRAASMPAMPGQTLSLPVTLIDHVAAATAVLRVDTSPATGAAAMLPAPDATHRVLKTTGGGLNGGVISPDTYTL